MQALEQGASPISPEQLLDKIQSGDKKAESELVNKYWRGLFFILNKRASDPELAADIAQDAFVVVITKARNGQIENAHALASFIRQVGINLLIASYRKDTRRKTDLNEHIDVQFAEEQINLTDRLNQQQLIAVVKQVLKELPTERDRDLLYRYFVYGQSKQLICDEIELSESHFDRVLYRARNRLKQILQLKFNIDSSKLSLTTLLTALLALQMTGEIRFIDFITNDVRENRSEDHFIDIAAKDGPSSTLDSAQFQQVTRLL